jgi:aldehyde:ferredoxin oxidoreductase
MPEGKVIKPRKRCCKSRPRCKRCPVVCKRLAREGLATKRPDGRYELAVTLRKKQLKTARA